ncbi:uncharacterized protein LOC143278061 [Babylonia areolata]|uniref:uncharacterized protein LOC143278061 n=1 Tax=Babylonia areolata TaxID=304850 RepID=UPI003FCF8B2F
MRSERAMHSTVLFSVLLLGIYFASCGVSGQGSVNQTTLDSMAESLQVEWTVVTNVKEVQRLEATLTLRNAGTEPVGYGDWKLYWYSVFPVEPDVLSTPGKSMELERGGGEGLVLTAVNGMLFHLQPTPTFTPLPPGGGARVLRFKLKYWSISRSDHFPNWYLTGSTGTEPRTIKSTAGFDPTFVTRPTLPQQQKRYDFDLYSDRTPRQRYHRNYVPFASPDAEMRVVPKPWHVTWKGGNGVRLSSAWKVADVSADGALANEVDFLLDELADLGVSNATGSAPASYVINLNLGNIVIADDDVMDDLDDTYSLQVDDVSQVVNVTGEGPSGVFLGLQTLLSLLQREDGTLPAVNVYDAPRFSFRGLFLDIARNFRSREEIEHYLKVMATYKLNRLHLHLADDEGWRIQIKDLPELTELGATRCHDPKEERCLLPQLGSGPAAGALGSGFLNRSDYLSILRTAKRLHIQVIPEIDMPGHSRAAIKAMELRYRNYMKLNNSAEALRYRLVDENDTSEYITPQFFNDNTINVCMESTYAFIAKIIHEVKALHQGIQDLHEYHVGLDEVANAWVNSSICQRLVETDPVANQSFRQYFFKRVSDITSKEGLALGSWEDGIMLVGNQPFNRSLANNSEVYVNVWDSVWEWGTAARTHNLANGGYKVVMSQASSLYFDHPYEPHWEERGYYWATRSTDTQEVFGFKPMDYYANIEESVAGKALTREEVCGADDELCPPLTEPNNIIGMQGHLWSETSRTGDQADSMLFPRVLALAERAWHFAPWEKDPNATQRRQRMIKDWYSFARAVGYRELPRLDQLGVRYRVPPPGAVVERQRLLVTGGYPGLQVEYSEDYGEHWKAVDGTQRLGEYDRVLLRTRSADGERYSRTVEMTGRPELPPTPQAVLDYMSDHLEVQWEITDNYETYGTSKFVATIFLNNTGSQPIPAGNWELQFPSVQWLEPEFLQLGREFILQEHRMALSHVQGYQFRLSPLYDFPPFEAGASKKIVVRGQFWSVSKYEQFPNYFVAAEGATARRIQNTAGESMSFVRNFSRVNQWKRDASDKFDPLTPSARYGKQDDVTTLERAPLPYLPSPRSFQMDRSDVMSLKPGWVVVAPAEWAELAQFLKDQLSEAGLEIQQDVPASRFIQLRQSAEGVPRSPWPGAYNLSVSPSLSSVVITANDSTGALYGIQSLLNMAKQSKDGATVFQLTTSDLPRFGLRSMFLDVARNFLDKESVQRLLRTMGLYKLNRLHLHLADDEGWRLEIPGLPELTSVGSTRCHDPTEQQCLTPVLGSGPDPDNAGTGFYTAQDYREILQTAASLHIEVVPEFDMPGHARAAIKAMAHRRRKKTDAGDPDGAREFELDEMGDPSIYSSVQLFDDNAVNPCLNSTYRFIGHVMRAVRDLHQGVNPLRVYHFGGDEVAHGAWVNSRACSRYVAEGRDLKFLFSTRVAALAAEVGLDLGCWEDGLMDQGEPIPRKDMAPDHVFTNAWQNVWEWGAAGRAYRLANAGYKVIMSQATHTYFDHPYEPDPEERGLYWATRYTDTRKVFGFQPQHLWSNVGITRMGDAITLETVCGEDPDKGCPKLVRTENVVGLQGHLWTETVRSGDHMDYMIFPRLLALAERAWRPAPWEGRTGGEEGRRERDGDWSAFANTVGQGQLRVLDRMNVSYRICPPGVRQEGSELRVNTEFPGLRTQFMTSDSKGWNYVSGGRINVRHGQRVHVRTASADGQRFSKHVTVTGGPTGEKDTSNMASTHSGVLCVTVTLLCLLYTVTVSRCVL